MYDSTYGDSWGGYGPSDYTVSDQTYADLSSGIDNYTQTAQGNQDHNNVGGNPWSTQNTQRGALTAGDQVPTRSYSYPGTDDAFGFWGSIAGRGVGTAVGGPVGGAVGDFAGGKAGQALGDRWSGEHERNR